MSCRNVWRDKTEMNPLKELVQKVRKALWPEFGSLTNKIRGNFTMICQPFNTAQFLHQDPFAWSFRFQSSSTTMIGASVDIIRKSKWHIIAVHNTCGYEVQSTGYVFPHVRVVGTDSRVSTGTGNLGGKWTFFPYVHWRYYLSQLGKAAWANYSFF